MTIRLLSAICALLMAFGGVSAPPDGGMTDASALIESLTCDLTLPLVWEPLSTAQGDVLRTEYLSPDALSTDGISADPATAGTAARVYLFPDGDAFVQTRTDTARAQEILLPADGCEVRYYDGETWVVTDSVRGLQRMAFISVGAAGERRYLLINPPFAYRKLPLGSIEHLAPYDGSIDVETEPGGVRITVHLPAPPVGASADWFLLYSTQPLVDWTVRSMPEIWTMYGFDGDSRWTWDGYHYRSEPDYEPSGENIYERTPALYTPKAFALTGGSRAAQDLAVVMLDVTRAAYGDEGYLATTARSLWLLRDYGIDAGFFDTRFNSDTAQAYLKLGRKRGIPVFTKVADQYAAFLYTHAQEHHYPVSESGGILVWDYWHPDGGKPTHVALNHQIAEILFLTQYADDLASQGETDAARYRILAGQMLDGIRATADGWIRADRNLHYAYLPDGTFGFEDYPTLTYDDLFELQAELVAHGEGQDPSLDRLMQSKLLWMRDNKITGYRQ